MKVRQQPLVSIVTPAYNEEANLAECIESVLAQTYTNWDYTIVNNCSKDETLGIAQRYAAKDPRIRVVSNDRLLPIIENHNHTIRQISPNSKYCKFVFADDWLYPACIEEMVRVCEANPTIGLVGSYATDGESVLWPGPPQLAERVSGSEICRTLLLGGPYIFGPMTSMLVNSTQVRSREIFFNENNLHADTECYYDILRDSDYGFVHQVLSFSRRRPQSNGTFAAEFSSIDLGTFVILLKYGPIFLQAEEFKRRRDKLRWEYYQVLAKNVLLLRSKQFWLYHQLTLKAFGSQIDRGYLAWAVSYRIVSALAHPIHAARAGWRWAVRAIGKLRRGRPSPSQTSS